MRVLVVGSVHHFDDDEESDEKSKDERKQKFREACHEIGRALASSGHIVIIGSDNPDTADPHILDGVLEAAVEPKPRVLIHRPESKETPFGDQLPLMTDKIKVDFQRSKGTWSAGRVRHILASDAVVVIGGCRGAKQVAYSAPDLQRPVVVIPSFGGAAESAWDDLSVFYRRFKTTSDKAARLREQWEVGNGELVVSLLEELAKKGSFRSRTPGPDFLLFAAMLFMFSVWVWLFVYPTQGETGGVAQDWQTLKLFVMIALSALLGTGLRTALRLIYDRSEQLSGHLLLNEATAGLVLAFALCLFYLVGGIAIAGQAEVMALIAAKEDFGRAAISMTLIGIAGGLFIERAAEALRRRLKPLFQDGESA